MHLNVLHCTFPCDNAFAPLLNSAWNVFDCFSKAKVSSGLPIYNVKIKSNRRLEVVCRGMLATRKFMKRKKKEEVFKDAADEAEQMNWRRMMREIEEAGSVVPILKTQRRGKGPLPRDVILGTLVRFKQLKKWNIVSEVCSLAPDDPYRNWLGD